MRTEHANAFHANGFHHFDPDGHPLGAGKPNEGAPPPRVRSTPWRRQDPATMPAREHLYGRLLQRGKATLTVAPGGLGKSALTGATEALAMATGRRLLHDYVPKPLRVWVWNLEEDQDELNRRLEAACQHFGIKGDVTGLAVNNGLAMPCRIATLHKGSVMIARPLVESIVEEIRRCGYDALIVDPFVSTHEANENDNAAIDRIAKEWGRVAHDGRCAVHLIHHTHKLHGVEVTAEASRGAKSLVDAVRITRTLNAMTEDEAASYGLKDHRRYFRATDAKVNYVPPPDGSQWFCHVSVHLANGDNVGVVAPFTLPDATHGVTVDHLDEVVRRAGEREGAERYREAAQSAAWIGTMIADVLGADLEMPAEKKRVKASLAMWLKSGALRIVEGQDAARRTKKFVVPGNQSHSDQAEMVVAGAGE